MIFFLKKLFLLSTLWQSQGQIDGREALIEAPYQILCAIDDPLAFNSSTGNSLLLASYPYLNPNNYTYNDFAAPACFPPSCIRMNATTRFRVYLSPSGGKNLVFVQQQDENNQNVGAPLQVSLSNPTYNQFSPSIAKTTNPVGFTVIWTCPGSPRNRICIRDYDDTPNPLDAERVIISSTNDYSVNYARIAPLGNGHKVVGWINSTTGNSVTMAYAVRFNGNYQLQAGPTFLEVGRTVSATTATRDRILGFAQMQEEYLVALIRHERNLFSGAYDLLLGGYDLDLNGLHPLGSNYGYILEYDTGAFIDNALTKISTDAFVTHWTKGGTEKLQNFFWGFRNAEVCVYTPDETYANFTIDGEHLFTYNKIDEEIFFSTVAASGNPFEGKRIYLRKYNMTIDEPIDRRIEVGFTLRIPITFDGTNDTIVTAWTVNQRVKVREFYTNLTAKNDEINLIESTDVYTNFIAKATHSHAVSIARFPNTNPPLYAVGYLHNTGQQYYSREYVNLKVIYYTQGGNFSLPLTVSSTPALIGFSSNYKIIPMEPEEQMLFFWNDLTDPNTITQTLRVKSYYANQSVGINETVIYENTNIVNNRLVRLNNLQWVLAYTFSTFSNIYGYRIGLRKYNADFSPTGEFSEEVELLGFNNYLNYMKLAYFKELETFMIVGGMGINLNVYVFNKNLHLIAERQVSTLGVNSIQWIDFIPNMDKNYLITSTSAEAFSPTSLAYYAKTELQSYGLPLSQSPTISPTISPTTASPTKKTPVPTFSPTPAPTDAPNAIPDLILPIEDLFIKEEDFETIGLAHRFVDNDNEPLTFSYQVYQKDEPIRSSFIFFIPFNNSIGIQPRKGDEDGRFQGDAGEYVVEGIAFDGRARTRAPFNLTVLPYINATNQTAEPQIEAPPKYSGAGIAVIVVAALEAVAYVGYNLYRKWKYHREKDITLWVDD